MCCLSDLARHAMNSSSANSNLFEPSYLTFLSTICIFNMNETITYFKRSHVVIKAVAHVTKICKGENL